MVKETLATKTRQDLESRQKAPLATDLKVAETKDIAAATNAILADVFAGIFDSHDIPPNRSWKYTANKAGDYAYPCTLHPNMKGTLKVE